MAERTLYNPASLKEDDLIANFVVRTNTFERIFHDIRQSDMRYPEKNYLIQGQRGMGKTTLLLRLKYEVERTASLKDWLVPVFFNEEAYDVNSLAGLWEKLLKYLDDHFDTDGAYYNHTEQYVDDEDYERLCFNYLIEKLHERDKKLVIFFDNFGELFLDRLRDKEKRRLREILIDCNDLRIIGASAVVINDLHDYSQPFFEFFQIIHLEGLSIDETYNLIAKLQEGCPDARKIDLKRHKGKIDTLAILTGGVIRTIMMLYQIFLDDPNGKALEDLEKVLDKVTPLYRHHIEDLPVQQRRIVDVIAKKWDAVSAKEIAAEIRDDGKQMSTKLISAQLAQLEKNNVVEKKATTTKNHFYQLKERFFNIWYLMRNGDRRDRKRVAWLIQFLEEWYDDDDSDLLPRDMQEGAADATYILKEGEVTYRSQAATSVSDEEILELVRQGQFQDDMLSSFFARASNHNMDIVKDVSMVLLSRQQYHYLYNQFADNPILKDLLKPIYYALMTLLKDEKPNEIVRIGDELKEPVRHILQKLGKGDSSV